MFEVATYMILFAMFLALVSAIIGKSVYDKILAVNILGTITVLFIALFGFLTERPEFLDIALVYALINFIATVAILKFFEYGDMGRSSHLNEDSDI
ncbi:MAG TPA: pH regulation protein F [Thiotrichaceae bacterium]|jgi:multicomponent Na+:H+ antiporter subunit F|nr:pH regulation protein F [Thiotrichaceae bacterium]HIM08250.1 pH regulation protein F [Gammaproteobacteria bacterium]